MKLQFTLIAIILCVICNAQYNEPISEVSSNLAQAVEESEDRASVIKKTAVPKDDFVLQQGELVYLQLVRSDDGKTSYRIHENKIKGGCVRLELIQKAAKGSMLIIHNFYNEDFIYDAALYSESDDQFNSTSVYPVHPGLSQQELWLDQLSKISLSEFRLGRPDYNNEKRTRHAKL